MLGHRVSTVGQDADLLGVWWFYPDNRVQIRKMWDQVGHQKTGYIGLAFSRSNLLIREKHSQSALRSPAVCRAAQTACQSDYSLFYDGWSWNDSVAMTLYMIKFIWVFFLCVCNMLSYPSGKKAYLHLHTGPLKLEIKLKLNFKYCSVLH